MYVPNPTQQSPSVVNYKTTIQSPATEAAPRTLDLVSERGLLDRLLPKSKTDLIARALGTVLAGLFFGSILKVLPLGVVPLSIALVAIAIGAATIWGAAIYSPQSRPILSAAVMLFVIGFILTGVA
jgi:hypothetical protein